MHRTSVAVLALVLLPSLVTAQGRSRDRGAKDNSEALSQSMPSGPKLSSRDIEGISPLRYLVDKRKDLKLTDEQLKQLKAADAQLKDANAPLLKQVDSLIRELKPTTSVQTTEDETRMVIARDVLMKVIGDIRVGYDAAAKSAMDGFDDAQKATAQTLLQKHQQESMEMMREKLGARGGAPGGRRGSDRG